MAEQKSINARVWWIPSVIGWWVATLHNHQPKYKGCIFILMKKNT